MKLISGIKNLPLSQNGIICIPLYHRSSLGLISGTEAYYVTRVYAAGTTLAREIILTTIIPSHWHLIRRIIIHSIESVGVLNIITQKLKDLHINVHVEEAITTQIGAKHSLTLIVDLKQYILYHHKRVHINDKIPDFVIEALKQDLLALKTFDNKRLIQSESISIRELTFLENISNINANRKDRHVNDEQFERPDKQIFDIRKGEIDISNALKNLKLPTSYSPSYTMFSDTEDKYIKILFFDSKQTIAYIDIFHEDVPGAIHALTNIISVDGKYNILASYSHQQMLKQTAHWYAIIDISNDPETFFQNTLESLAKCRYGQHDDKRVLRTFLVESNTTVDDATILKFGQSMRNEDGEVTSIYKRKTELLRDFIKSNVANAEVEALVWEQFALSETQTHRKLVKRLVTEETNKLKHRQIEEDHKRKRNWIKIKKSAIVNAVSLAIIFLILVLLIERSDTFKNLVEHGTEHTKTGVFLVAVLLGFAGLKNILHFLHHKITDDKKE